jgi:hypothetical protein
MNLDQLLREVWAEARRIGIGVVRGDLVTAAIAGISTVGSVGSALMNARYQSAQARAEGESPQLRRRYRSADGPSGDGSCDG